MAVKELIKFREKYPEYSDIDDVTLANKLASKYPEYSDLPNKVGSQPKQKPRKDIIDAFTGGKELIPENRPYARAAYQTAKDIVSIPADYINQRALNYPRAIAKQFGMDFPEPESGVAAGIQNIGGVVGGVQSGTQIAKKFGLMKPGQNVLKTMGKTGAATAAYADTDKPFDAMRNAEEFATGAAIPAVGKVIAKGANIIGNIPKGFNAIRNEASFGDKVMLSFHQKKRDMVNRYGDELMRISKDNPNQTTPALRSVIDRIKSTSAFDPKLDSVINRVPSLKKLVNNPELADSTPLSEIQDIINKINSKIPGKKSPDWIEVYDLVDDIRSAQLDAFPEMSIIKEEYANIAEPYRIIKNKIKEGSILKNLATKFGDAQLNRRAESLMTKEIKSEVDAYRQTKKLIKFMGLGAGAAGAGEVGRRVFNQ